MKCRVVFDPSTIRDGDRLTVDVVGHRDDCDCCAVRAKRIPLGHLANAHVAVALISHSVDGQNWTLTTSLKRLYSDHRHPANE